MVNMSVRQSLCFSNVSRRLLKCSSNLEKPLNLRDLLELDMYIFTALKCSRGRLAAYRDRYISKIRLFKYIENFTSEN